MTDPHSDQTTGYHLFIEPAGALGEKLQGEIDALAQECGGPSFVPHVTLLAAIPDAQEEEVMHKARQLAAALQSFEISLEEEGMEDAYFRALYLHAGREGITDAHAKANEIFSMSDAAPYTPHLSLLYGNYPEERKRAALAALPVAPGAMFRADALSVWQTPGGASTWKKIATLAFGADGRS